MSYQVLARKWRPRTFEEVVGQQGVTQTLRNALASGRLAQAFVFAGARGVGKTTTARILAKALNCVSGPTASPCGECDACVEIAEGRDIDVLEIDAATNTQVDKVRETIIEGLALRPVRDRYKIFIIDEVHMLSTSSFNALLKSIEEPPAHVVFVMATTELHKIPDTITSRSQVYEFRTISTRAIHDQLRTIADAEAIDVEPAALALIARSAEGSLRDAESAFDQVIAFAGERIAAADVISVLGLVGRDLLMDVLDTVADENAPRVFDLVARVVESGQDLRLLVRELGRVVRDMMVLAIDPSRASDPEFAPEGDLERLAALTARFSREDLLRAFDLLSRTEFEVRTSPHPRYHLEMALLKWIHLRKLVPLSDLIQAVERGERGVAPAARQPATTGGAARPPALSTAQQVKRLEEAVAARRAESRPPPPPPTPAQSPPARAASAPARAMPDANAEPDPSPAAADPPPAVQAPGPIAPAAAGVEAAPVPDGLRQRILDEIKKGKKVLYNTAVAQAQRIDVEPGRVTLAFTVSQKLMREQVEQQKAWLEAVAERVAGGPFEIVTIEVAAPAASRTPSETAKDQLKQRALGESAVQAMLDVFTAEIRDVEEIDQ